MLYVCVTNLHVCVCVWFVGVFFFFFCLMTFVGCLMDSSGRIKITLKMITYNCLQIVSVIWNTWKHIAVWNLFVRKIICIG